MIEALTVVTPKKLLDRSSYDPNQLQSFERVTGIKKTRRWEGATTELAIRAANEHVARFGKKDFDAVIVVTQSQDRCSPCMAIEIHKALGFPNNIPCFDMNQSCDGFIYGLWVSSELDIRRLVICVDKLRAPEGTLDNLIFSDAACAVTVNGTYNFCSPGFLSDGTGSSKLCSDEKGLLRMDGGAVYDWVTSNIPNAIKAYAEPYGPFDFLAQHQPNMSMIKLIDKRSGFEGRSLHSIEEYGNMSMVSIPMALALNEEKILGKSVLMVGYGAGWSAAVMGVDWPKQRITQIVEVD